MKNQIKLLLILLTSIFLLSGCGTNTIQNKQENNKPTIVTTFYPIHEITQNIVENTSNVELLIPTGTEPHSFEPTPKQIVELSNSDTFITMGGMFNSIEQKIIQSNSNIKIIESTKTLELEELEELEEHEENNSEHNHEHELEEFDPHVWLSMTNMKKMTNQISKELIELYPENKELYQTNTNNYLNKLEELETKYTSELKNCQQNIILVNHKSFGYLAHEYNFTQISVSGFNPESEPSPKTIKELIDTAKENNLKYIFAEGQMDPKIAKTLATEINGEILELNPIITTENNYFEQMENNLKNLKLGLECK